MDEIPNIRRASEQLRGIEEIPPWLGIPWSRGGSLAYSRSTIGSLPNSVSAMTPYQGDLKAAPSTRAVSLTVSTRQVRRVKTPESARSSARLQRSATGMWRRSLSWRSLTIQKELSFPDEEVRELKDCAVT